MLGSIHHKAAISKLSMLGVPLSAGEDYSKAVAYDCALYLCLQARKFSVTEGVLGETVPRNTEGTTRGMPGRSRARRSSSSPGGSGWPFPR